MLRRVPVPRASRTLAIFAAAIAAACSVLPPHAYPPFVDLGVAADCVVPADGRLRVPASAHDCVVHELTAEPAAQGEAFGDDGARWLLYAPGTRVRIACRFRVYAADGDPRRDAKAWLPDAVTLRALEPSP